MMIRGGTSRGAYFNGKHLPEGSSERDALLVRAMGGPDPLQVDGIGGGHPLTSKVAVVSASPEAGADVDYLFLQVDPIKQRVSAAQNCGNLLAGVGLYAIANGLAAATPKVTVVRVCMLNTGGLCHLEILTPGGEVQTEGDASIDGVPGTAAPILCNYLNIAGSTCGTVLPTGGVVDEIEGVSVTCVDNGMPVVAVCAEDLGITGYESPEELDSEEALKAKLEALRLQAGPLMRLGDVRDKSVPKMCLVSAPQRGGLVMTRTFIPHVCHKTIGVLGAVSAATACLLQNTAVAGVAKVPAGNPKVVDVEHAEGALTLQLELDGMGNVVKAGVVRTARILFKGEVCV